MRRRWGRGFAIAAALAAAAVAAQGAGAGAGTGDGVTLAEAAGIARHLEAWPEVNVDVWDRARASLDPESYARLAREVQAAFATERLLERVEPRLASLDRRALLKGYLDSGAAFVLGHPEGLAAADLRDLPDFASRASRGGIAPARLALVARLDDATGWGRNGWRVTQAWGRALERGARALRCEGGSAWQASLPPDADLVDPFRERVHVELLFLNRERTTADLRRAVQFLESAPSRAFHQALAEAIEAALADATGDLREQLAPQVRLRCP